MRLTDELSLGWSALREHPLRTGLSMLGIAVGVAAVVLLTSIGEGTRRFVVGQFQQFGANILQVTPGKAETFGLPGALGGTTRKLTLDDSEALRRVRGVEAIVPVVMGMARVESGSRGRSVYVFGTTVEALDLWKLGVRQGSFLPPGDPRRGASVCVLGPKLKRELFGEENAAGRWVRIADRRLRVIGVLEPKGSLLGFDMDDVAYVPAASAMRMFDTDQLAEIDVAFSHESLTDSVVAGVRRVLTDRHGGHEDFTIVTQAGMLEVFDEVLGAITAGVAGIAAISLLVGAIGVLTMMWISVGERTFEIGLVRAIGATEGQVRRLFLLEAVALAGVGGLAGLAAGFGLARLLGELVPGLPVETPFGYALAALAVSALTGLASGVLPAGRAARLDPIEALRDE
jgi:putative ABC transport system permease protein